MSLWAILLIIGTVMSGLVAAVGLDAQALAVAAGEVGAVIALFTLVCAAEAWT